MMNFIYLAGGLFTISVIVYLAGEETLSNVLWILGILALIPAIVIFLNPKHKAQDNVVTKSIVNTDPRVEAVLMNKSSGLSKQCDGTTLIYTMKGTIKLVNDSVECVKAK